MKRASEARQEAKTYKEIAKLKDDIENSIEKAITKGKFSTTVSFSCEVPDSIRNEIVSEMESLGYHIAMPKYEPMPAGCPSDQWKMYDSVAISWSEITA